MAAMTAFVILAPATAAADPGDVETVYCLADIRRPEVVQAAVHLGKGEAVPGRPSMLAVGSPGQVMTLEEWRENDPENFTEVCAALLRANSDTPAADAVGLWNNPLLLLIAGSVLTMFGAFVERLSQHRRQRLDILAAAIDDFRDSAGIYLDAWELDASASHDAADADRRKLIAALRGLRAAGGRREAVRNLSGGIPLAHPLSGVVQEGAGRARQKVASQREEESREQRRLLDSALETAEGLVHSPVVWHWRRVKVRLGRRRGRLPGGDGR